MGVLEGKVAIVTGASRGIGRAIAERLTRDGASVAVNYANNAQKAQDVVQAIAAHGGKAKAIQADVSRVSDIKRLFDETVAQFARVDILVNNAGDAAFKPLIEFTEKEYDYYFALNTKGVFFAMQEAAHRLEDGGRIINISSGATIACGPGTSVYAATKAAIETFAAAAAKELGTRKITVNTVSPGMTMTDLLAAAVPQEAQQQRLESSPLGRLGQPEDIADVVAFLVGPDGRWITGENIRANGGAA